MFRAKVNLTAFNAAVRETLAEIESTSIQAVTLGARAGAQEARANHRHTKRSGNLTSHKTLRGFFRGVRGRTVTAEILNTAKYAKFVEYGTRPHRIYPKAGYGTPKRNLKRGQSARAINDIGTHRVALRWYVGGKPRFARYVNHPGTRPYPFMIPAMVRARNEALKTYGPMFSRLKRVWHTR